MNRETTPGGPPLETDGRPTAHADSGDTPNTATARPQPGWPRLRPGCVVGNFACRGRSETLTREPTPSGADHDGGRVNVLGRRGLPGGGGGRGRCVLCSLGHMRQVLLLAASDAPRSHGRESHTNALTHGSRTHRSASTGRSQHRCMWPANGARRWTMDDTMAGSSHTHMSLPACTAACRKLARRVRRIGNPGGALGFAREHASMLLSASLRSSHQLVTLHHNGLHIDPPG